MLKKIKIFLFSSLAALMTLNVAKAEKSENSYSALSYLSGIDDERNELVAGSKRINGTLPTLLKKLIALSLCAMSSINLVPCISRYFYGKALWNKGFWRLNEFSDNNALANHVSDGIQVIIPAFIGASLLRTPKNQETLKVSDHYLKRLILDLAFNNNGDKNSENNRSTVININNYYNTLPDKMK